MIGHPQIYFVLFELVPVIPMIDHPPKTPVNRKNNKKLIVGLYLVTGLASGL